jgi:Golgi phosphoprotein 3 GPP34
VLALTGHVDVEHRKRLVVLDAGPTGDETLDRSLAVLQRRAGRRPESVLAELGRRLPEALYARLVAAGLLRCEHGKVLGIFPTTRWPTASADHELRVRRALTSALVDGRAPEPRDGALIALVHALRATHRLLDAREHGLSRRDLDRRAKQVAEGSWGSQAVRRAVDEAAAAVTAAVSAAVAASAASTVAGSG